MTTLVTPSDIINHRMWRKASGMVGCMDGSDIPLYSLKGISWRPADPKNPSCFCFDCRDTWDADGTIDAELVNSNHSRARDAYAPLLLPLSSSFEVTRTEENGGWTDLFPKRSGTEWHGGVPLHITLPTLSATHFDEIPTSLPAPRHRDVMNETFDERMKNDLAILKGNLQSDLVVVMDSKRGVFPDTEGRDAILTDIHRKEIALMKKIDAIKVLLSDM